MTAPWEPVKTSDAVCDSTCETSVSCCTPNKFDLPSLISVRSSPHARSAFLAAADEVIRLSMEAPIRPPSTSLRSGRLPNIDEVLISPRSVVTEVAESDDEGVDEITPRVSLPETEFFDSEFSGMRIACEDSYWKWDGIVINGLVHEFNCGVNVNEDAIGGY